MRAMILAAGLGTRMGPLSARCAKPALPVRGVPLVAALLAWLYRSGVDEVALNLHHRGEDVRRAARHFAPPGLKLRFIEEPRLRGTGGGISGAAEFLAASDPCVVIPGDMLLDLDLGAAVTRHRRRGARATLLLGRDPRAPTFGTVGLDAAGSVCRIAESQVPGAHPERERGVFFGVRLYSPRLFACMPAAECFEDLRDWLAPELATGAADLCGELLDPADVVWEPVGTPAELLAANVSPPRLSYPIFAPEAPAGSADLESLGEALGVRLHPGGIVVGPGARVADHSGLSRVLVWADEEVAAGRIAHDAVLAGGASIPAGPPAADGVDTPATTEGTEGESAS